MHGRHARHGGADDLPRRRHGHAPPLQPRGQEHARPGHGDAVRRHRPSAIVGAHHVRRHGHRRRQREERLRGLDRPPARSRRPSCGSRARRRPDRSCSAASLVGIALAYMGLKRRGKTSPNFIIGSDADADAPVSPDYVPSPSHPLVAATGADYVVNVTPRMTRRGVRRQPALPAAAVHRSSAAPASRCRRAAAPGSTAARRRSS